MSAKTTYIAILFIFIGIYQTNAGTSFRSSRNYDYGVFNGNGYGGHQQQPLPTNRVQTPKEYLDDRSGFSTFGIISIIFAVIMACLLFYYGIMCYPFLCRDEKKYRFMDVSSTAATITTMQSRSMQSIENYPVDSKMEKSCV